MRFLVLTILMVFSISPAFAQKITAANWQRHPKILEITKIHLEFGLNAGMINKFKKETTSFKYCQDYEDVERTIVRDKKLVRRYSSADRSKKSKVQRHFTYDEKGVLRFAFIKGDAVNKTKIEHRVFFDETGKRIWEMQKLVSGPGYSFPKVWPEEGMVHDPEQAYNAKNPCPKGRS